MKKSYLVLLSLLLCLPLAPMSRGDDKPAEVDWDKVRSLHRREQKGETLTGEEKTYLERGMEARKASQRAGKAGVGQPAGGGKEPAGVLPPGPPRDSTGMVPLTQLTGDQKYKGVDGGLYGGGKNEPPAALMASALAAATKVQPLGVDGKPAADGRIVLMSMGMSNTTMEFSAFKALADQDSAKSPKVTVLDAAQGGQDALKWNSTASGSPWDKAEERMKAAGVTDQQVQVIWLKQALMRQSRFGEFPKHSDELKNDIESNLKLAKERFPNLKLVYLSSRIYAGYATGALNPEPYAYEGAFSVRGVIEDAMKNDPSGPVVLWGPYLWTDGVKGREDGLVWKREDCAGDGTHPSTSGRQKVAELLLKFFKADATAKGWFVKSTGA